MSALKIDQKAIDRLKTLAESVPPLDMEVMLHDSLSGHGSKYDKFSLYVEPGFNCVYTHEIGPELNGKGTILLHLSISSNTLPVTDEVILALAEAFGLGDRASWSVELRMPIAFNIVKVKQ